MKQIFNVLMLALAVNFLVVAGAATWLVKSGHVDKEKALAIKEIVFPSTQPAAPATQPVADAASTRPALKLEELLAKSAGRPAAEQLQYIRQSFDAQMAQLDQAAQQVAGLRAQVEAARAQLSRDRSEFEQDRSKFEAQRTQATKIATDKGFQDTLELYQTLPPKQVKTIFMTMDDKTVVQYLQAMEGTKAAKLLKEFKTDAETLRAKKLLEMMRTAEASVKE